MLDTSMAESALSGIRAGRVPQKNTSHLPARHRGDRPLLLLEETQYGSRKCRLGAA